MLVYFAECKKTFSLLLFKKYQVWVGVCQDGSTRLLITIDPAPVATFPRFQHAQIFYIINPSELMVFIRVQSLS